MRPISRRAVLVSAGSALVAGIAVSWGAARHVNVEWFYHNVILATLRHMRFEPKRRAPLLLGTALVESGLAYVRQINGPAKGYFQMEPRTHDYIWSQLKAFPDVARRIRALLPEGVEPSAQLMSVNAQYACAMAAVLYEAVHLMRQQLPAHADTEAQARYWKRWWNTSAGKGTVEGYLEAWERAGADAIVQGTGDGNG